MLKHLGQVQLLKVQQRFQESLVIGTDATASGLEALTLANGERLINTIAAGAAVGGPISGLGGLRSGQEADILSDAGQQARWLYRSCRTYAYGRPNRPSVFNSSQSIRV